jgi:hypothetical protein
MDVGIKGGDKLLKLLRSMQHALGEATVVHVGFLEGSTAGWNGPRPMKKRSFYASAINFKKAKARYVVNTDTDEGNSQPAAYIASIMEYGDPKHNIPPRPFFSTMIREKGKDWHAFLANQLRMRHYDSRAALEALGLHIQEQLKDSILHGPWAELKSGTIKAKGFDTPLIDSHNMINSVDFAVL